MTRGERYGLSASLLLLVGAWVAFFFVAQPDPRGDIDIASVFVNAIWLAPALILVATSTSFAEVAFGALMLPGLVLAFAWLYETSGGNAQNWGARLSHVDAVYIAVGTLATAGTGTFAAHTDDARMLLTLQMVLDLIAVTFVVGTVFRWVTVESSKAQTEKPLASNP